MDFCNWLFGLVSGDFSGIGIMYAYSRGEDVMEKCMFDSAIVLEV